ncbi:hypothetical protein GYB57_01190 [bacterium]|nr:hypothetical protein [bacterium]
MIDIRLFFLLTLLIAGCVNPIDNQADYLLPTSNRLTLIKEKEFGITKLNVYEVEGNIDINSLSEFPVNVISEDEKSVMPWHRITEKELKDLEVFIKEEQSSSKIARELFEDLVNSDDYLVSSIYDKDNDPIGGENYSMTDWVELYFINLSTKELIHISYGKF